MKKHIKKASFNKEFFLRQEAKIKLCFTENERVSLKKEFDQFLAYHFQKITTFKLENEKVKPFFSFSYYFLFNTSFLRTETMSKEMKSFDFLTMKDIEKNAFLKQKLFVVLSS
jgi:hypothetical protein